MTTIIDYHDFPESKEMTSEQARELLAEYHAGNVDIDAVMLKMVERYANEGFTEPKLRNEYGATFKERLELRIDVQRLQTELQDMTKERDDWRKHARECSIRISVLEKALQRDTRTDA